MLFWALFVTVEIDLGKVFNYGLFYFLWYFCNFINIMFTYTTRSIVRFDNY